MRLLSLLLAFALTSPASAEDPPNILFIFLDDFGWRDTGYMGSDFYETPHIDRLANEGMVFTNAYSASANCAPARASLMSGQYTSRHKVYNVGTGPRGKAAHRKLLHVPGVDTLDPAIQTWAQELQRADYRTATMGKWHVSNDPGPYGFDVNVGGTHSGGPPNGYYPPHGKVPGLGSVPEGEYITDTLSQRASEFITETTDQPWCLYLTHFAVHTPIQAKKTLLPKYEAKTPGDLHSNAKMATMIEAVDQGVGEILETLEKTGQRDRTIVLFFSDNGGYGPATDMDPLKGYKGTYYEGGIRVPFFANWPGKIAAGENNDTPIIGVDLYPTLCALAGTSPTSQTLDGADLTPLFFGKADDLGERDLFWHFPAYLQSYGKSGPFEQRDPLFRSRPCSVIRAGDWKLHHYFEDDGLELYHLGDDLGETTDLADRHPEKRDELYARLDAWRVASGADLPTEPNPDYDAEKEAADLAKLLK